MIESNKLIAFWCTCTEMISIANKTQFSKQYFCEILFFIFSVNRIDLLRYKLIENPVAIGFF